MIKKRKKCKISSLTAFSGQLLLLLLRPAVVLPVLLLVLIHSFSQVNYNELARRLAVYHLSIETGWDIKIDEVNISKKGEIKIRKLIAHDDADDDVLSVPSIIIRYNPNAMLANPIAPLAAITAIDVNSPDIIVRRDKSGKWNFDNLLKKPQKPTPVEERLQAEITIANGHLIYTDAKGWPGILLHDEELNKINVIVTPSRTGVMPFEFSAYDASKKLQKITGGGTVNINSGGALIRTDAFDIDIRQAMKMLPAKLPVTIENGAIDMRMQLVINSGEAPIMVSAVVGLKNLRGKADTMGFNIPFEIKNGSLDLNENGVIFTGLDAKAAQTDLTLSGTMTGFKDPVYDLHLTASKVNPLTLVNFSPSLQNLKYHWSGALSIDADINGTVASPAVRAKLSGLNIGTKFGNFQNFTGEIRYADEIVTVSNMKTDVYGGSISGDLWVNGSKQPNHPHTIAILLAHADGIEPGMLQEKYVKFSPPASIKYFKNYGKISGAVSGKIAVKVTSDFRKGPIRSDIFTDLRGKVAVNMPVPLQGELTLAGKVQIVDDKETTVTASLSQLELATPNGTVRASGRLKADKQIIVDVQASKLNLEIIRSFTNFKDVSGDVYLSGTVTGPYLNPSFAGRLHVTKPRGMGYAVDDIVGDYELSFSPDRFIFKNIVISANDQHLRGSLALINKNGKNKANLLLSIPRTSLKELLKIAGLKNQLPFDGVVEGEVALQGVPDNPEGKMSLIVHQPVLQLPGNTSSLFGTKLSLDIELKDGIASINNGMSDFEGIPVAFSGEIPVLKKELPAHLDWTIDTIDQNNIAFIVKTLVPGMSKDTNNFLDNIDDYVVGSIEMVGGATFKLPDFSAKNWEENFVKSVKFVAQMDAPKGLTVGGIPYSTFEFSGNFSGKDMMFIVDKFEFGRTLAKSNYSVKLTEPNPIVLRLLTGNMQEIDAGFTLKSENLNQVRRDIIKLADKFKSVIPLQKLANGVKAIPTPFSAVSDMTINITGALSRPLVETKLKLTKLLVGNIDLPDIDAAASYDGGANLVNFEHLLIAGRDDIKNFPELEGLSIEMRGGLTLPGLSHEEGQINMSVVAQEIQLSVIGKWLHINTLQQLHGKVSITADISSDMDHPNMQASVDIEKPEYMGFKFDSLSSFIVTVDENGIWMGRWHNRESAPENLTIVREIGNKVIFEEDAGNLSFISDNKNQVEPLQLYGYMPFKWAGPLMPSIPLDKDCYMEVRLPRQGLSCVRSFLSEDIRKILPKIDSEDGKIESQIIVGGPINNPVMTNGNLKLSIPQLTIKQSTPDFPDKLSRLNLDVDFHPNSTDKTLTMVDIRDLSAVFDRPVVTKKDPFAWVKKLVGIKEKKLPLYGSLVAQGTVQIDPDKLHRNGKWIPATEFADNLRYDIYLQTVRAPIRWREAFNGSVTAFLHLHNRVINNQVQSPILEGLAYAENSVLGYDSTSEADTPIILPLNPELSIALIIGEGNSFELALPPNIVAKLPFTPTTLFPPLSASDMDIAAKGQKLPITNSFVYAINSEAMTDYAAKNKGTDIGTYGLITGKLINPIVDVHCYIDPSDAKIQLPGGNLYISSGQAEFKFGKDRIAKLITMATATGQVDEFAIEATINGDLLDPELNQMNSSWLKVETTYAPPGKNMLSREEIFSRLFGFSTVANTFSKGGISTVFSKIGTTIALPRVADLLREGINNVFGGKILETMNLTQSYDKTGTQLTQYPALSVTTSEFFKTKYSSFRIGASRTFVNPPDWKLWITYHVPNNEALKNFSITAETNSDHINRISAQYKIDF